MKFDTKSVMIFILMAIIGALLGYIIGQGSRPPIAKQHAINNSVPADDGKLAKHYKEKELVQAIRDNAKDLQKCYFDLLDKKPKITEGVLKFIIKVEEDGRISSFKTTKNDFLDEGLSSCVTQKFLTYYLSPPPYGINRYIAHVLAFKSEETAKREAIERAEKSKPPKMLPVK